MLIKKGRKPFNVNCDWTNAEVINRIKDDRYIPEHSKIIFKTETHWHVFDCNIRDLVSKSSWLWQFVCENHLYIYKMWENKNFIQDHFKNEYNECCYQYLYDKSCYEYYLLESSLKDESELEDFLLSNIKVDVKGD